MIDAIIKLLERITKFGEIRESNRQKFIDRYATPALNSAEIIYRDYLVLLHETRRRIKTFKKVLPLLQFLEKGRLEQLPTRIKLRAVLRQTPGERWTKFELGIMGLMNGCVSTHNSHFTTYPLERWHRGHTVYDMIAAVEYYGETRLVENRRDLLQRIEQQIKALDKAWEFVCAGYAELSTMAIPEPKIPEQYRYKIEGD